MGAEGAYLSRLTIDRLSRGRGAPPEQSSSDIDGALLWIDVSGFTALCERLSRRGREGAEQVSELLDRYYGTIVAEVERTGGDVLFFAGDGALVLWRARSRTASTERALRAARALRDALHGVEALPEVVLRVRMAVTAGPTQLHTLGGVGGHWIDVLVGGAVDEVPVVAAKVSHGGILLSAGAREALRGSAREETTEPELGSDADPGAASTVDVTPSSDGARGLSAFLPEVLAARSDKGRDDFLAEVRTVSVLFLDLSEIEGSADPRSGAPLHLAVRLAQEEIARHEGMLHQVVQDDKGLTLVAAFGLPGRGHEDDSFRAVRCAQALVWHLRRLHAGVRAGVTSGSVFCGPCGTSWRRQYCLVGESVNRAARLMAVAERGAVLADEAIFEALQRRAPPGRPGSREREDGAPPVAVHASRSTARLGQERRLLGRARELEQLDGVLIACGNGTGGVAIIEGVPGIGKTTLVREVWRRATGLGLSVAIGAGDPIENRTPYFGLRQVLRQLSAVDEGTSMGVLEQLRARLAAGGDDPDLAPLLAPLFGLAVEATPLTSRLTGAVQSDMRADLIARITARAAARGPWMVICDDVQWLDAASWSVLGTLRAAVPTLSFLFSARPMAAPPARYLAFEAEGVRLALRGLAQTHLGEIVAEELGALPSSSLMVRLVDRAGDNPLFWRELALTLRRSRRVEVRQGAAHLPPELQPVGVGLPESFSAAITSRLDGLSADVQLTLKVASVLGPRFEAWLLRDVLAANEPLGDLGSHLDALVDAQFLRPSEPSESDDLAFTHAMVQSAVYDLLPARQRRALHAAAARSLETRPSRDRAPTSARLSYHWAEAGDPERATRHAASAADAALASYANEDAVRLFEQALALDARIRAASPGRDVERARWQLGLAQAHYSLTQPRRALEAYRGAAREIGFSEPGWWSFVAGIAWLARAVLGWMPPGPPVQATGPAAARTVVFLGILNTWGTLDLWEGRLARAALKAMTADRLAVRVISSPRAAEAISGFGYVLGVTPLGKAGEARLRLAILLSDRAGDPEVQASTRVLLGMHYTLIGRASRAVAPLTEAQIFAGRVGAGHWKHRTRFMLGEALLHLGRFDDADAVFTEAANLSRLAEPPIVGFANAMRACVLMRRGRPERALALLDAPDGLSAIRGEYLTLQRFASLGPKIEVLMALGRWSEATAVAREADAMARSGSACNVFLAGILGHSALAAFFLTAADPDASAGAEIASVWGDGLPPAAVAARRALARLRAFARQYPAARPLYGLMRARDLAIRGQLERASRVAAKARQLAKKMNLSWEQTYALPFIQGNEDDRPAPASP